MTPFLFQFFPDHCPRYGTAGQLLLFLFVVVIFRVKKMTGNKSLAPFPASHPQLSPFFLQRSVSGRPCKNR
ncbi:hypothetical protein B0I18_101864 [Taibaiella chishuiensis]|uniref:Uncharacterized protein n=1 Tax=Taibaiella chishuiensis TaxID=1434707 RepID=A0A2P8DBX4_9BACT|nr:hypothetical protein B0I18_101864 [Taibaiella chishuiensis]